MRTWRWARCEIHSLQDLSHTTRRSVCGGFAIAKYCLVKRATPDLVVCALPSFYTFLESCLSCMEVSCATGPHCGVACLRFVGECLLYQARSLASDRSASDRYACGPYYVAAFRERNIASFSSTSSRSLRPHRHFGGWGCGAAAFARANTHRNDSDAPPVYKSHSFVAMHADLILMSARVGKATQASGGLSERGGLIRRVVLGLVDRAISWHNVACWCDLCFGPL